MKVPCVQATVMVEPDKLKDAWEDYLDDNYDVKLKGNGWLSNKDLLSAKKTEIIQIAPIKIDIFTRIEPRIAGQNKSSRISFYTFMGYEIPTDPISYPLQYQAMKGIFQSFLGEFIPEIYQKELELMSEEISALKEEKKDARKEVAVLDSEIAQNQQEIMELKEENAQKQEKIESQKILIESIDKDLFKAYMEVKWYENVLSTEYADATDKRN